MENESLAASIVLEPKHDPVMLEEILETLQLKPGDVAVDGTLGLGGHSLRFAAAVKPGGTLVAFDWDAGMFEIGSMRLSGVEDINLVLVNNDFRTIAAELDARDLKANGILLDLGLNSAQVDDSDRGISFMRSGPLDMRMDRRRGEPASALLNRLSPHEIEKILFEFGDERWAKAIAKKVVERRKENPLRTTTDLVDAVLAAIPPGARDKRIHPATRTFQAVRIAVNGELDGLEEAIEEAAIRLTLHGRIAILSYHSGEDRIVKNGFRKLSAEKNFKETTKKPLTASASEISRNPRSRSAKLRVLERVLSA